MLNDQSPTGIIRVVQDDLDAHDLARIAERFANLDAAEIMSVLERMPTQERAVVFRVLPKDTALDVFEAFDPPMQRDLVESLQDAEVAMIFAELDPDDRVWLLDELPASLSSKLLQGLSDSERQATMGVLGYPHGSVGRRITTGVVTVRPEWTVAEALRHARAHLDLDDAAPATFPVTDAHRTLRGTVSLGALIVADTHDRVDTHVEPVPRVTVTDEAEWAAREVLERGIFALPVTDSDNRYIGIFAMHDAARVLEREESEDAARQGGVEPLHRPYLTTSILSIVRSRIVWLFALAVGASLTVQVLSAFEATLEQLTVLALFVPLLIGTGGNTGNQAATTVTRALALGDVEVPDIARVLGRELRVGICLGVLLGTIAFGITGALFGWNLGLVIGLTLLAVCTMAATVGGVMPIIAKLIRVDPAVFSNPFITTFVDATGLLVYFFIARALLGL